MRQCTNPELDWIEVPASRETLGLVNQFVLEKARSQEVLPQVTQKIELVLEEVIVNIVSYAFPQGQTGTIKAGCALVAPGRFQIRIVDQGRAFDPLAQPDPDTVLSLEDRNIGGLGIHLVREMTDHVEYQRHDRQNILDIMFAW